MWCRQVSCACALCITQTKRGRVKRVFCMHCTAFMVLQDQPMHTHNAHAGPIAIQASTLSSGYLCIQTARFATFQKHPAAILTHSVAMLPPPPALLYNGHTGRSRASRRLKASAAVVVHFKTRFCGHERPQAAQYVPALIINYWSVTLACLIRLVRRWRLGRMREYSHRSTSLSARSTPCLAPAAG